MKMPAVSIEPKSISVVHQNYISPFSTIPPLSVTAYHSKLALVRYPRNATANWPFAASFNCAHISRTLLDRSAACGKVCIWPFVCGPNFFGAHPRAHSHTHTHTHTPWQIAQQSMLPFYNTWNFFWTIRLWLRPALDVDFYLGAAEQRSLGV